MNRRLPLQQRWVQYSLLVGFWTLVAVIFIARNTLLQVAGLRELALDYPFTLERAVWLLLAWYMWIPSTIIVVWMVRRFPLTRGSRLRNAMFHLAAAPVLSLLAAACFTAIRGLPRIVQGAPFTGWFPEALARTYAGSVGLDSFIYLSILAAIHAFDYHRRYHVQDAQLTELKADLAEAQLHAIKLQLHPHLLFNTFDTVSTLVQQRKNAAATDTIAALSDFLRGVLDNSGAPEVDLRQEIDFLERYVAVEQIRFGDRLEVTADVDPDLYHARVPNLIIQSLVEKAVHHGVEPGTGRGRIDVMVRRERDQMCIRIRTNGGALHQEWNIEHTEEQLARHYRTDYRLAFTAPPNERGTLVTIVIPYRPSEKMAVREE